MKPAGRVGGDDAPSIQIIRGLAGGGVDVAVDVQNQDDLPWVGRVWQDIEERGSGNLVKTQPTLPEADLVWIAGDELHKSNFGATNQISQSKYPT